MENDPIVVSYFDKTGIMVEPWREAGYPCYIVDLDHTPGVHECKKKPGLFRVGWDLSVPWMPAYQMKVEQFFAFPPCTDLSVSGSKFFKLKGLRRLSNAINLFATAQEFADWAGCPYMIENPVSTISTYWRKSDYRFDPCDYTGYCAEDNYSKKTCLWTGNGFVMPEKFQAEGLGEPDDRIHKAPPGHGRADFRSATPKGFARAVFEANHLIEGAA